MNEQGVTDFSRSSIEETARILSSGEMAAVLDDRRSLATPPQRATIL